MNEERLEAKPVVELQERWLQTVATAHRITLPTQMAVPFCSKNHCVHNCPHWLEEEDPEIDWSEIDGFLTEPSSSAFRGVTANMVSVEEDGQEGMTWEDDPSEEPRENLQSVPPTALPYPFLAVPEELKPAE